MIDPETCDIHIDELYILVLGMGVQNKFQLKKLKDFSINKLVYINYGFSSKFVDFSINSYNIINIIFCVESAFFIIILNN